MVFVFAVNDALFYLNPVKWKLSLCVFIMDFKIYMNWKTRQINANYSPFLGTTCNFG
ncbi:hypothetical protein SAMN04488084_101226 [Pedobacter antarcticus]|nr:hypothetical protein SAMN04488084_101226 [Pedobacter antarcticus]